MTRPTFAVLSCLMLGACAPALREPPTVVDLAGITEGRQGAPDVDPLLREAERSFAERNVASVRRAARSWLVAASADEARVEGLIGAARAGVWLSEHETEAQDRTQAARSAVNAAQLCSRAAPGKPNCAYWLAVALGVQAREVRTTVLDALPKIVALLERAAHDAPEIENAGPDRVLALVLLRAPGWPTGPGDPERGLAHARRAVALDPDYPPNQLCLAEAYAENDDPEQSRQTYALAAVLAERFEAAGEPDAEGWLAEARNGHPPE